MELFEKTVGLTRS